MAGFCSFFRSESFSDTNLAILLPKSGSSSASQSSAAKYLLAYGSVEGDTGPASVHDCSTEDEEVLCIPVHKVVLVAKSAYFSARLTTAVGDESAAVIREHAGTLREADAMEAVLEFMYTEQLPLHIITDIACPVQQDCWAIKSFEKAPTHMQRLTSALTIADRWQVCSCFSACCSAVSQKLAACVDLLDLCALFELPEELRKRPEMLTVIELAMARTVHVANSISLPPSGSVRPMLAMSLAQLPKYVRLDMLKGCCLRFPAMFAFLSSKEAMTDSEDSMAMLLISYLKSDAGKGCTYSEIKLLKDQIRYQHLSTYFVVFELPGLQHLSLDKDQLSQLLFIRGMQHYPPIPERLRQPTVPASWYLPPREQQRSRQHRVEILLNVPEATLSDYLKGIARLKSGGAAPSDLHSDSVECMGTTWVMTLQSPLPGSLFCLAVQPSFSKKSSQGSRNAGLCICANFRVESAFPQISRRLGLVWVGEDGVGLNNFVKKCGKRPGDPTDPDWWREYIKDGHVRFVATVRFWC